MTGAKPRRFRNNSACSPRATTASTLAAKIGEIHLSPASRSARMSIARIWGSSAAPKREPKSSRRYFPASTFAQLSRLGVAEAKTTAQPAIAARSTAMSRAWYKTPSSCL